MFLVLFMQEWQKNGQRKNTGPKSSGFQSCKQFGVIRNTIKKDIFAVISNYTEFVVYICN